MTSNFSYQLKDDEEEVVHDEGPFSAVAICCDTEEDGPDGSEHEDQCNSPSDVGLGLVKSLGEFGDGERDGEEIEGVPGLSRSVSKDAMW